MLEEFIHLILPSIIAIIELIGIFVVAVSAVQGFYHYLRGLFGHKDHNVKLDLANGMATGLEFKVASEILKNMIFSLTLLCMNFIFLKGMVNFCRDWRRFGIQCLRSFGMPVITWRNGWGSRILILN